VVWGKQKWNGEKESRRRRRGRGGTSRRGREGGKGGGGEGGEECESGRVEGIRRSSGRGEGEKFKGEEREVGGTV